MSMRRPILPLVALTALGLVLAAPAPVSAQTSQDSVLAEFVADRQAKAQRLEKAGDLAGALQEWRYVDAVTSGDSAPGQAVRRLEAAIDKKVSAHLRDADAQFRKGRTKQAKTLYLKVLALDPDNSQARTRLTGMEEARILAGQDSKDAAALKDYRASKAHKEASAEAAVQAEASA